MAENAANTDQTAEPVLPHKKMIEELEKETPVEQTNQPAPQVIKKERKLIKLFRIVVWLLVALALPVGVSLRARSESIESFADGTSSLKLSVGNTIFYIALVAGSLNLILGIVRWVLRIKRKHCTVGRVIGKLIGGGIWRTAVFMPIIITSLLFFSSVVNRWVEEKYNADQEAKITSSQKITEDYNNGKISADAYVRNLLYASFDTNSLPEEYRGAPDYMVPDFANLVSEHFDELSEDTLLQYYEIYSLGNVRIGTDASGNELSSENRSILSDNAYATKYAYTTLNKAKLSKNGHFVIFYTDTGADKIEDDDAENIGDFLERDIEQYKEIFGLDYTYIKDSVAIIDTVDLLFHDIDLNADMQNSINEVLDNGGIDRNILETAMPIYVVDPVLGGSNTNAAAYYSSRKTSDIFREVAATRIYTKMTCKEEDGCENSRQTNDFGGHIPSFPFILIYPETMRMEFDDLKIISTHELAHHYQHEYCIRKSEKRCTSTFFLEGPANFMAMNAVEDKKVDNVINVGQYNDIYVKGGTSDSIDSYGVIKKNYGINGKASDSSYPLVAYFENLYELSGNDYGKFLEMLSISDTNGSERIREIYGEEIYRQSIIKHTERILLNDYDEKLAIKATSIPEENRQYVIQLGGTATSYIEPSASRFHYFDARAENEIIIAKAKEDYVVISILGETDEGWKLIESSKKEVSFATSKESLYKHIAIVGINYDIYDRGEFSMSRYSSEMYDMLRIDDTQSDDDAIKTELEKAFGDLTGGCVSMDINDLLEIQELLLELGDEILNLAKVVNAKNDYSELEQKWTDKKTEVNADIEEARNQLSKYEMIICANIAKEGTDFNKFEAAVHSTVGGISLKIAEINDGDLKAKIFSSYDLRTATGQIYSIIQDSKDIGLITLRVREK